MGDTSNLNQKKRKIAVEDDEEDDPSRTLTVRTTAESHEKEEYKHKDEEKKIPKKVDSKTSEEAKKPVKTDVKPKAQAEKSATSEKKPEKSIEPKSNPKDSKASQDKKKAEVKKPAPSKKSKKEESESESSSSSGDDSSGSDSSSESEKKPSKPKKKVTPKKEKADPKKVPKPKDELVYEVLKRWWYCMEDWPPKDFDYSKALLEKKLRKVDIKFWKHEPEIKNDLTKVFEINSYPGIFKTKQGEVYDLRPKETCPCFENLRSKPVSELLNMLIKALKNQISALENSDNCDIGLLNTLKKDLLKAEKSLEASMAKSK